MEIVPPVIVAPLTVSLNVPVAPVRFPLNVALPFDAILNCFAEIYIIRVIQSKEMANI